ncbi:MAG: cytochrome c oxidase subunit II [Methylovirgula sp.]
MNSETGTEACADRIDGSGYVARRSNRHLSARSAPALTQKPTLTRRRLTLASAVAAAAATLLPTLAQAGNFWEFREPVTPIAHDTLFTHDVFLAVQMVVFIIGLIVLLYVAIQHRKAPGRSAATFSSPRTLGPWIVVAIPVLVLALIDYVAEGIPGIQGIVAMANTKEDAALVVRVIGSQWKWRYEYPDQGIAFTSNLSTPRAQIDGQAPKDPNYLYEVDNPLVLPVGKKVRILISSLDVIHAWSVPSFGVKQDAIPGFLRETWVKIEKPGIYRSQCGELCGIGHSFMPIVVEAKAEPAFAQWVAQTQKAQEAVALLEAKPISLDDLMARGKTAFEKNCSVCHQSTGLGLPGAFPPLAWGHVWEGAPADLTNKLVALGVYKDGKILQGSIERHLSIVLHGIPDTAMPAWGPQLDDVDIAAIVTYERNSFGNHTAEATQPAAVKAARSKPE